MLYGGVRLRHLVQPVFPLQRIKSELLPSPSRERERQDLGVEMQLPRHKDPTQLPNYNIHSQVRTQTDEPKDTTEGGFDMSTYFNDLHHPALHHNSSMPYNPASNTNNVLALRLFPVNIGIRDRTEAIRLRTEDCLMRVRHSKLTARLGLAQQYPLSLGMQQHLRRQIALVDQGRRPRSLCSGALHPSKQHTPETLPRASDAKTPCGAPGVDVTRFLPHMKGLCFHPPPSSLSIFTRPQDCAPPAHAEPHRALSRRGSASWMPFQMLKPMGYNWSPGRRSSGTRGPTAQLVQERLDQKGFGWKRKSRYLWQQDIHTAGFRPHRFY
eukprot:gene4046-2897_t